MICPRCKTTEMVVKSHINSYLFLCNNCNTYFGKENNMTEENTKEVTYFSYRNGIDEIADYFGHRSNSIASTYLLGLQNRSDKLTAQAFTGSVVMLCKRQKIRVENMMSVGLPLTQDMFEQMAFNIRLLYSGDGLLLGEITEEQHDEFAVASSNMIGYNLQFSILQRGDSK